MSEVSSIEVLVQGTDAESLTSLQALQNVGINVAEGKVSIDSSKGWTRTDSDDADGFATFQHTPVESSPLVDLEVEVAVNVLNSNGA